MTRRLAAVLAVLPLAGLAVLAAAPPAHAAAQTITFNPVTGSVSPTNETLAPGAGFAFSNGDPLAGITVKGSGGCPLDVSIGAGNTSDTQTLMSVGTCNYTVVDAGLGRTAAGTITIKSEQAAPSSTQSAAPGGSAATSTPAPGSSATKAAAPGRTTTARPSTAPARGVPALPRPSNSAPFAGPSVAYPGGVLPSLAPPALVNGSLLPPVVAPYTTATAPNGDLTTLFSTYTPTASPSPAAAVATGNDGGGGGSGRSLGLPAAVTAVLLAGLVAALLRLLLAHPAARTVARRH